MIDLFDKMLARREVKKLQVMLSDFFGPQVNISGWRNKCSPFPHSLDKHTNIDLYMIVQTLGLSYRKTYFYLIMEVFTINPQGDCA